MPTPTPDLDRLFSPRSVAVAGASTRVDSAGHDYVVSLRDFGFEGPVYPINPKADEIAGYKAYGKLSDVPGDVDLVISGLPAHAVTELIRQCAEQNVRFLHLLTGRLKHLLIGGILPDHQIADDDEKALPFNVGNTLLKCRLWPGGRNGLVTRAMCLVVQGLTLIPSVVSYNKLSFCCAAFCRISKQLFGVL